MEALPFVSPLALSLSSLHPSLSSSWVSWEWQDDSLFSLFSSFPPPTTTSLSTFFFPPLLSFTIAFELSSQVPPPPLLLPPRRSTTTTFPPRCSSLLTPLTTNTSNFSITRRTLNLDERPLDIDLRLQQNSSCRPPSPNPFDPPAPPARQLPPRNSTLATLHPQDHLTLDHLPLLQPRQRRRARKGCPPPSLDLERGTSRKGWFMLPPPPPLVFLLNLPWTSSTTQLRGVEDQW